MTKKTRNGNESLGAPIELESFFPYRLSVFNLAISKFLARFCSKRFNISIYEWRCMAVLGSDQPKSANDVCARTNMDGVQVSRAIATLQKTGPVTREADNSDRRFSSLRLTAKGQGIYNEIVPMALEREAELLAVVTEGELDSFNRTMDKLHDRAVELESLWPETDDRQ
jgi:DNA-binding MarR family transcriptional regulator